MHVHVLVDIIISPCLRNLEHIRPLSAADEVQKNIKSLMAQYGRERHKTRKRKSGDGLDDV